MNIHLVDLGASELTSETNVPWSQCKQSGVDEDTRPDFGRVQIMGCLGAVARPAPQNDRGAAQGVVVEVEGGTYCVGGYDPRSSKMAGEIQAGESAYGATGEDFDSRALFKDQVLALIVGDDHIVVVDRKRKEITINCPGGIIKVSEKDGIVLADASGKSSIHLKGEFAGIIGRVVLGGRNPKSKVADATKVDTEFKRIWGVLNGWTPVSQDGGAALKATVSAVYPTVQSTASGVSLG